MRLLFFIAGALLVAGVSYAGRLPAYRTAPCPPNFPQNAVCGVLTVVENRQTAAGEAELSVLRLQPAVTAAAPAAVLGGGGPGGGLSLDDAAGAKFWEIFRQDTLPQGELLLIDQRGAGQSRPLLSCPALREAIPALLARPLTPEAEDSLAREKLLECRHRLLAAGVDITAYTTENSAIDMEELRQTLDLPAWNIIGFSYGTRLAMEVMRRYPDKVRAALLDSMWPFDASRLPPAFPLASSIGRIAEHCKLQQHCRRHAEVLPNLRQALRRLENSDEAVALAVSSRHTVALTPTRLLEIIHAGLYYETGVAALPMFARQLAQGETDTANMEFFLRAYSEIMLNGEIAEMLNFNITCQEEAETPDKVAKNWLEKHEQTQWQRFLRTCRTLGARPSPPTPVVTALPVLLVAGAYDPATPGEWAEAVAARLPNAQFLSVPAGHTPTIVFSCLRRDIRDFFATPAAKVKNRCDESPLVFF